MMKLFYRLTKINRQHRFFDFSPIRKLNDDFYCIFTDSMYNVKCKNH